MPSSQTVGVLIVKLLGDASGYQKMLAGAQKRLKAFGTTMSMYVTAPLAIMGGMAVREFAKFDQAMTESTSIMKVTADQAQRMREQALALSKVSAQGPDEMARSYYFLASAGLNAEQAMAALPVVTAFATAGAFDMAKATEYLTDAQSALGLKVADATQNMVNMARVADVLVYAANASNASVEQFAMALTSKAGSSLKMFNKSVEEGVAVLAVFADQGIKAELAGNNFSRVMLLLGKAQLDNKAAFDKYNLTLYDGNGKLKNLADIIQDLERVLMPMSDSMKTATLDLLGFEARVQGAILPLIGASSEIRKYEKELRAAGGTTADVAGKQMKSFSNQIKILWNNVKVLAIEIGEQLAPKILMLGGYVKDTIASWNSLSAGTKSAAMNLLIFAAAVGPLAVGISVLIKFVSMLGIAIAAVAAGTPIAMILIAAAVTVAVVAFERWLYRMASGAEEFEAKMESAAKAAERTASAIAKAHGTKFAEISAMPRGDRKTEAVDNEKEKLREQLAWNLRDLQGYKRRLDAANTYWGNVFNSQELQKATANYDEADALYKATLKRYKDYAGIEKTEKAEDINKGLAEMDRMDQVISRIADYTKEQQKLQATVGMTEAQVKLWEFAQEGATEAMLAEARAASLLTEALERTNKAKETGIAMMEEYLTPLEKFQKKQTEIMQLLMVGAIGKKTADRASLAANKEYKDAEKALLELQKKANIRINYDFMNNKMVEEGTDEFYRLMQLVPEAGRSASEPIDKPAGPMNDKELRELEYANYKLEMIARNTAKPPVVITVKNAGL